MKYLVAVVVAVLILVAGGAISFVLFAVPLQARLAESEEEVQRLHAENEFVWVVKAKEGMRKWSTIPDPNQAFERVQIPKTQVFVDALLLDAKGFDELKGRRLRRVIEPGEILTPQHLLVKEVTGFVGMIEVPRAMSVRVASDFIARGRRVNVIHNLDGVSTVILTDILILEVDLPEKGDGTSASVLTLQLDTTEQVLKLAEARDKGTLSVVLSGKAKDQGGRHEFPVPKGKLAKSIPITADKVVEFFVVPGFRVNLVHTINDKSQVVLEDIVVLALEVSPDAFRGDRLTFTDAWLTIQLDDLQQALKLDALRGKGTFGVGSPKEEKERGQKLSE